MSVRVDAFFHSMLWNYKEDEGYIDKQVLALHLFIFISGEGYLKTLVIMLSVVNIGLQSTEQLSL
jgi:hypothetical protein